jgi:hypothetical protein
MVLDDCMGALNVALMELGLDRETLLILVGCRGYALGEHGAVGGDVRSLYGELIHIPCLVRLPGAEYPPPRSFQLMTPSDLRTILDGWFQQSEAAPPAPSDRQYLVVTGDDGEAAIRTPAWMLRRPQLAASDSPVLPSPSVELYAKPDDRWEANEVADRLPDIAARLLAVLHRSTNTNGPDAPLENETLDEDLIAPAW